MGVPTLGLAELVDRVRAYDELSEDLLYTVAWNICPELDVTTITDGDQAFRSRFVRLAHLGAYDQMAIDLCHRKLGELGTFWRWRLDQPVIANRDTTYVVIWPYPSWEAVYGEGPTLAAAVLNALLNALIAKAALQQKAAPHEQ